MHNLSIVAMFKNESSIIKQWIKHYIEENVEHFYLIDNGSTDNYENEIKEYEDDDGHRRLTRKTTTRTVFLYESKKNFFVIRPNIISYIRNDKPADYFREILGKGPRRGHKEKDWFFDLIYYIID